MVARSPAEVISGTRQTTSAQKTTIMVFFTARKLTVLGILPKGSKFNQPHFINYFFGI
jgi:hypothetical protein